MKILGIPKPIVAGIIFLLSSVLVVTPATAVVVVMPAPPDACTDANAQARDDTNNIVWMLGGCLATVLTVLAAQIIEPEPPASALLGQSPEYVAQYTDCYQRTAKKIRTNKALTGCLIGAGAYVLLYAVVIAAAATDPYYY